MSTDVQETIRYFIYIYINTPKFDVTCTVIQYPNTLQPLHFMYILQLLSFKYIII